MSLKILLVEPNDSIRDLIQKNLEREFGSEVFSFKETTDAVSSLDSPRSYDLFIVRNATEETIEKPKEMIAAIFLNIIYDKQLKTPLVVIGEFEHTFKKYALISDRLRIEELNRLVLKALNLKKEDFSHLKLPDYIPYSISYFYLMTLCPCDVFIKLTKKSGDEYVKRLHFGESFTKDDLSKYEELGLKEFFILKEERELFMNGLLVQSLKNLRSALGSERVIEATGDSFSISTDLIKSLGINANSVVMVDQTLQQMKNQITKNDKLGQLLRKLLDDQLSYAYRRSFMICLFSYTLFPKMEWGSQEQQTILLEKITMVSFFHDIYLEEERLLKIMDNEAMKKANLTPLEKDLVINHANKAALLIQSYPKLPQGVDLIIKQHHGVSNGVGFPEFLTAGISPMAIFFVVIEDFVTQLLEQKDTASIPNIMINLKAKYQLPTYRKVVTEIEAVVGKK
jgi:HD-GYP domain-containing protein (c-di-GMP phosphodiesterase class II)